MTAAPCPVCGRMVAVARVSRDGHRLASHMHALGRRARPFVPDEAGYSL